jgi:hypothetical protein
VTDDKSRKGPTDATRVNLFEPYDVTYWAEKWNVSPAKLKAAVSKVGPLTLRVAHELRKQQQPSR